MTGELFIIKEIRQGFTSVLSALEQQADAEISAILLMNIPGSPDINGALSYVLPVHLIWGGSIQAEEVFTGSVLIGSVVYKKHFSFAPLLKKTLLADE